MYSPNKNNPVKINLESLKEGLSKRQQERIAYEADLLRKTPQELLMIAPFLFSEGITAANTNEKSSEVSEKSTEIITELEQDVEDYYPDYSYLYGA